MAKERPEYTDDSILYRCENVLKAIDEHFAKPELLAMGDLATAARVIDTIERRKRIHVLGTDTFDHQSIEMTGDSSHPLPMVLMSKQEYFDALGPDPDGDDDDGFDDDDDDM